MSTDSTTAIAGLAKTAAGTASQFHGASQMFDASSDVLSLSEEEASAVLEKSMAQAALLRQHANADYADISTLQALAESHTRTLETEERRAVGGVIATAQASGVSPTSGSPLLAELTTSIEYEKRIGSVNLTNQFGARKLRFAAEEALRQAEAITKEGKESATSTLRLRALQAKQLRDRGLRTALGGFDSLLNKDTTKSLSLLFSSKADNSLSELS